MEKKNYNPVEMAYQILLTEMSSANKDLANYQISYAVIEEAIGYLGEALDN